MDIQLRPVRRHDVPQLAVLLGQLGYPTTEESARERLDLWAGDPAGWLIGADHDGELVGVAALHVLPLLQSTGKMGRLVALVVDESHRSRGVGQLLVAAAEDQARAAGCIKMEVTSRRHRTRTHEFYRLLGYEDISPSSARFIKLFPADRPPRG